MTFARVPARGSALNTASATSIDSSAFVSVAGRPICGYVGWEGGNTTVNVTDLAGNTYVVGTPIAHSAATDQVIAPFYCLSSIGHAANVVSVEFGAARIYRVMQAEEYSHSNNVQFVDFAYGECISTATAITSAIAFTGTAGLLFVGCKAYNNTTLTAGGSLSLIAQEGGFGAAADQILSADGSYTASMTNSTASSLSVVALAFKEAPTGATVSTITGTTSTEGSAVVFTTTMSGTGGGTYAYNFSGTATAGVDYTSALTTGMCAVTGGSGSVTVSGSNIIVDSTVTTFTVTVPTTADTTDETNETIILTIGGTASTGGTITDDDPVPAWSVSNAATVTAGSPAIFIISADRASALTQNLTLGFIDGTRVGGVGYTNTITNGNLSNGVTITAGVLTIPAGVTSFTVSVGTV